MCAVIPVLFLIEAIDVGIGAGRLDVAGGIIPHRIDGLDGVIFSPFLHAGWDHLYGNSMPLILVGTFALAGGTRRFLWSTLVIMLVSGFGVWIIGDPSTVVVGASGVIFGYLGLLVARGFVERSWWNLGVAAFIGLLYWYQLYNVLPDRPADLLAGPPARPARRRGRGDAVPPAPAAPRAGPLTTRAAR